MAADHKFSQSHFIDTDGAEREKMRPNHRISKPVPGVLLPSPRLHGLNVLDPSHAAPTIRDQSVEINELMGDISHSNCKNGVP